MSQKKELIRYYGGFRKEDIKLKDGLKKGFVVIVAFKINTEKWIGVEMPLLPVLRCMWHFIIFFSFFFFFWSKTGEELLIGTNSTSLKDGRKNSQLERLKEIQRVFLVAQIVKNLPAMWKIQIWFQVRKIPWRMKWQPTSVFLPEEFHG